jgi:hypothetical protein
LPAGKENPMPTIDDSLRANRAATHALIESATSVAEGWDRARTPGKWSPSQIVEHVARCLDGTAQLANGLPSAFPRVPSLLHPALRIAFRRIIRKEAFPRGRTTKGMNPDAGPPTPADGRARLDEAQDRFETACRDLAARGEPIRTPMFGPVPIGDFVRFMTLHTEHHRRQIGGA